MLIFQISDTGVLLVIDISILLYYLFVQLA